ncbi:MAG TPA: hypothetical protein VH814_23845 [Steroidobacteraceae bacterium]|jgi:hypothetical protein
MASLACAAPQQDKVTEEVIVKGSRPEVEKRVNTFVSGVTHRGYMVESLVRWNNPICPLVAGIPANQGEFVLQRLSQAVRDVGAPLGPANCKPNFHVILTPDPDQLIALWRKRAPNVFGRAPPQKVRRILGKPRPVRVWYNAWEACAEGVPTGSIVSAETNFGLQMSTPYGGGCLKDSHIAFTTVNVVSSVIVLVDLDDVQQIKLGPLTDYISMVGLTDVDLDGDWGDEPTILRLFAATGAATSLKMSIWDRAFLKALYSTSQVDRHQRTEIARAMVKDFVRE